MSQPVSVMLRDPVPPLPLADESRLSLCLRRALLPPLPFFVPLVAPPTALDQQPKKGNRGTMMAPGGGGNVMTRQFNEVMINLGVQQVNQQKFDEAINTFTLRSAVTSTFLVCEWPLAYPTCRTSPRSILVPPPSPPPFPPPLPHSPLHLSLTPGHSRTFLVLLDELGNSAPALIGRGTAYALSGKMKEAIEDYSLVGVGMRAGAQDGGRVAQESPGHHEACELEPKMVDAWRRRAQARAAIGEVDGALEDFTTALSLEKGQMDLLMERGMVYVRARRFYEAAKDLRAVVAVMPKEELAHVALSAERALYEAAKDLRAVIAVMPKEVLAHVALTGSLVGWEEQRGLWLAGDLGNTGRLHFHSVSPLPSLLLKAESLVGLGGTEEAMEIYEKLVAADSKNTLSTCTLFCPPPTLCTHSLPCSLSLSLSLSLSRARIPELQAESLVGLGETEEAMEIYEKVVDKNPGNRMAWLYMGQAAKELAMPDRAEQAFRKATQLEPRFAQAYRVWALLKHAMGDHKSTGNCSTFRPELPTPSPPCSCPLCPLQLPTLPPAAAHSCAPFVDPCPSPSSLSFSPITPHTDMLWSCQPLNVEGHYIKGSCHHALGQLQDPVVTYDALLSKPTRQEEQPLLFMAFYQREVAQFTASRLNKPLRDFDFEDNFGPEFKQAWARRSVPTDLFPAYRPQPYRAAFDNQLKPERHVSEQVKRGRKELVKAADTVGGRTQYTSPGFLPNQRQHRAAGMAALEMMQAAQATREASPPCPPSPLLFFSILLHPSPPFSTLTQEEFEKGFGAVTAMVQGHSKNLRYYANYDRAFALIKDEMLEQGAVEIGDLTQKYEIPVEMDAEVEAAETPEELWNVVGQNFLITVPCFSTAQPDYMLNGTTLAVRKLGDGAFDFAIKMPLTPPRWKEYDAELTAAWKNLCEVMADAKKSKDDKLVKNAILRVVYYWYNFSPLSRGSAMAGYSSLLGLFLAAGKEITAKPPPDVQLDWEAILSPTLEEFITRISKWLFVGATDGSDFHELLDVHEAFPTVGSAIRMLSKY
ncbi:unnamed protein product [Closterium sp. Naga37s-1]|nr:unnamed protein product [Closterium sp. Naga37s-1]